MSALSRGATRFEPAPDTAQKHTALASHPPIIQHDWPVSPPPPPGGPSHSPGGPSHRTPQLPLNQPHETNTVPMTTPQMTARPPPLPPATSHPDSTTPASHRQHGPPRAAASEPARALSTRVHNSDLVRCHRGSCQQARAQACLAPLQGGQHAATCRLILAPPGGSVARLAHARNPPPGRADLMLRYPRTHGVVAPPRCGS